MQNPQEARPRARSPFTAAFLSLLFPGLGQLYAGAPMRALMFAAPVILALALTAGIVLRLDTFELFGAFLDMIGAIFVFNIVALVYRLVAIVDAYRVAEYLNAHAASGDGRLGRREAAPQPPLDRRAGRGRARAGRRRTSWSRATTCWRRTPSGAASSSSEGSDEECEPAASADPSADPSGPSGSIDVSADPTEPVTPEPSLIGTPVPVGRGPAVGRQGAAQHPAHRRRRAEGRATTPTR